MRLKMAKCDDTMDGEGRAMSGTIALRESVSFAEEARLGCSEAVDAA
jgi:hypothetical protein